MLCIFSGPSKSPQKQLYEEAVGLILVFNVTDRNSFDDVNMWYVTAHSNTRDDQKLPSILIGNKCDLVDQREVSYLEAKDFAAEKGMLYVEVSAKDGTNVELILPTLATLIIDTTS